MPEVFLTMTRVFNTLMMHGLFDDFFKYVPVSSLNRIYCLIRSKYPTDQFELKIDPNINSIQIVCAYFKLLSFWINTSSHFPTHGRE